MYMNSPTVVRQKKATFSPGSRIFYYCQLLVPQWEDSKTTTTKISALQYVSKNVLNKTKLKHLCSEIHITKTTAHKKNYKRSTDCLILQLHKDLIYPFSCKPSKASWAPPPLLAEHTFSGRPQLLLHLSKTTTKSKPIWKLVPCQSGEARRALASDAKFASTSDMWLEAVRRQCHLDDSWMTP